MGLHVVAIACSAVSYSLHLGNICRSSSTGVNFLCNPKVWP